MKKEEILVTLQGNTVVRYDYLMKDLEKTNPVKETWELPQPKFDIHYNNEWFHYLETITFESGDVLDVYMWEQDYDYVILM